MELARRLLQWGIAPAEVEGALFDMIDKRVSLMKALARRSPELIEQVERELVGLDLPSIEMVRVSPELTAELPPGLCERLLAVPVHRDPKSGRVDVAAADVFDPHVLAEFGYHLSAPVRILRARLSAVESGVGVARGAPKPSCSRSGRRGQAPPGPGLPAPQRSPRDERTPPPSRAQARHRSASNGSAEPERKFAESVEEAPEPVLSLARPKGHGAPSRPEEEAVISDATAPTKKQSDLKRTRSGCSQPSNAPSRRRRCSSSA